MKIRFLPLVAAFSLGAAATALTGFALIPRDDSNDAAAKAIAEAVLDYPMSYYTGDGPRMERRLHPDLRKCVHARDRESGEWGLREMTAEQLVQIVASGSGTRVPENERRAEVKVLDIYGDIASVRIAMRDWVDYLHVAKIDGEWKIINVLWDFTPEVKAQRGAE